MTTSNIQTLINAAKNETETNLNLDDTKLPKLSTTSIHISRDWVLPERSKPGRKPLTNFESQTKNIPSLADNLLGTAINSNPHSPSSRSNSSSISNSNSDSNSPIQSQSVVKNSDDNNYNISSQPDININEDEKLDLSKSTNGNDSAARRRKQNRDAQRAYRERKANRIKVFEDTVHTLQINLDKWQSKYKNLANELNKNKLLLEKALLENETLKNQNETLQKNLEISKKIATTNGNSLENMIQNFKPMQAIPLNKNSKNNLPDLNVWKPGSCDRCKADPNNRAFCKSIFEKNNNPLSALPNGYPGQQTSKTSCNSQGNSSSSCNKTNKAANKAKSGGCCSGCIKGKKQYVPISDTYQRIRKHMTSKNENNCLSKLKDSSRDNSALSNVLEKIAVNLEINGREVEITSVEQAIDNINK